MECAYGDHCFSILNNSLNSSRLFWWVGADVWQLKRRSRERDVAMGSSSQWPDILFVLNLLLTFPAAVLCLSCWLVWRAPWVGHGQPVTYKCSTIALYYTAPQNRAIGYFPGQTFKMGLDWLMLFSMTCYHIWIRSGKLHRLCMNCPRLCSFFLPTFFFSDATCYWNCFAPGRFAQSLLNMHVFCSFMWLHAW